MPTILSTEGVAMTWTEPLQVPVQLDHRLQEVIDSVMRGIEEARRGEGTFLTDEDLQVDDDDDE